MKFIRSIRRPAFFLLMSALSIHAAPPQRGYLDAGYPAKALSGKRIYLSGLSKANTDTGKLLDPVEKIAANTLEVDSLLATFNGELLKEIKRGLDGKTEVMLDEGWRTGKGPEGPLLTKLYGDSAVPDTLRIHMPTPESVKSRGLSSGVSILIGRCTFGLRGYGNKVKPKYTISAGPTFSVGHGMSMEMIGGGIVQEDLDEYGEPKNQEKPNKDRGHGTNKIFISTTEFCFFDHASQRAFGYGYDVTETKYHGDLMGSLTGEKFNVSGHFSEMADHIAGIFLRTNSGLIKKYAKGETAPATAKAEPEAVKEVLEPPDGE